MFITNSEELLESAELKQELPFPSTFEHHNYALRKPLNTNSHQLIIQAANCLEPYEDVTLSCAQAPVSMRADGHGSPSLKETSTLQDSNYSAPPTFNLHHVTSEVLPCQLGIHPANNVSKHNNSLPNDSNVVSSFHSPQLISHTPLSTLLQTSPKSSSTSFSPLQPSIPIHSQSSLSLSSSQFPNTDQNETVALLGWQAAEQQTSYAHFCKPTSRDKLKSTLKRKRVTVAGSDGYKYSLTGKRIGRPKVNRGNTRCHECDAVTTPQWRFLTHEEILTCPIPLKLPPLVSGMEQLKDSGAQNSNRNELNSNHSSTEGIDSFSPTLVTGEKRKVCLCNACWLRVHKARQKMNGGGLLTIPRRKAPVENSRHSPCPLPFSPSATLLTVLEEVRIHQRKHQFHLSVVQLASASSRTVTINTDLLTSSLPHQSIQSLLSAPFTSDSIQLQNLNVRNDASNAAVSIIERAATLATRENISKTEIIWLAPGLQYGGTLDGQPVIVMNGQDVLLLPSIHATASQENKMHLQQSRKTIEQHILQHISDQIRGAQQHDATDLQHQQQEIDEAFQVDQTDPWLQPESLEFAAELQYQLQQRQQSAIGSAISSSSPSPDLLLSLMEPNMISTGNRCTSTTPIISKQESLASLTAAAEEFLSAAVTAAPFIPTISNGVNQSNSVMVSPLATASLDIPHHTTMECISSGHQLTSQSRQSTNLPEQIWDHPLSSLDRIDSSQSIPSITHPSIPFPLKSSVIHTSDQTLKPETFNENQEQEPSNRQNGPDSFSGAIRLNPKFPAELCTLDGSSLHLMSDNHWLFY